MTMSTNADARTDANTDVNADERPNDDKRKQDLRNKLRRRMKNKQSFRLTRDALVYKTKKKTTTEKGQQEMIDMVQNMDMNAVAEAMKTREHQRRLKNFKM